MKSNPWFSFAGFFFLIVIIEWAGGKLTSVSVADWYLTLKKPVWTPPSWLFGPVWTILYLSIAVSGWLIWMKIKACQMKLISFLIYGAQLAANLLWSFFFFFLKNPFLGVVDICVLLALIAINIFLFVKLYKPAGLLLIPYFLWTLYAFSLNLAIWVLNR